VAEPVDDAHIVFKGGTSLSKAFGIIERFSEDVDVLLVTRELGKDFGKGSVDKILKLICTRAGDHLGLSAADQALETSGTGVHRKVRYNYPAAVTASIVQPGVLLEMGVRGRPNPSSHHRIRSFVSQHATEALGVPVGEYDEFAIVEVDVLDPERTLFEKLALLHHLASTYPESEERLRRATRHLYDVYKLLTDAGVRIALERQRDLAEEMAADVEAVSVEWAWPHTRRPDEGYAASPIFDASHPCQQALAAGWDVMRPLIYGDVPTLDQCRQAAAESHQLL